MRLVTTLALGFVAGCTHDTETSRFDATMRADGYALFEVKNDRQQHDDVAVRIREPEAGATYLLLYAAATPASSGWFQFDPGSRERCGGSPGPHCDVGDGFGFLVDLATAPSGGGEIVLRHGVCECDRDRDDRREWSAYYAVMRVERTGRPQALGVEVVAHEVSGFATAPEIHQLQ